MKQPTDEATAILPDVMHRTFDLMMKNKPIKLSALGISELNVCWENSGNEKWWIQTIHIDDKITLCSENHLIFRNTPLEWLDLYGA